MKKMLMLAAGTFVAVMSARAMADPPYVTLKVTEVTTFKDGNALITSRGPAVTLEDGWCRTKDVPAPVLGTFWAFSNQADVDTVRSATVDTKQTRPCLILDEVIQANVNKPVTLVVSGKEPTAHEGTLLGILQSEAPRDVTTNRPPGYDSRYDYQGRYIGDQPDTSDQLVKQLATFVMLKTDKGVEMLRRDSVLSVTAADPQTTTTDTRPVREISFHLSKDGKPAAETAAGAAPREVGIVYLQKGIRWIPEYRIELLADNKAKIMLQGTVINEIADMDNVALHLVVGVPNFVMKDTLSPLALRDAPMRLSAFFAPPPQPGQRGQNFDQGYANSMTAQQAAYPTRPDGTVVTGPNIPAEGQLEDLYVYHKSNFTLKKGGRAVVQLLEVTVPYEDVYTWDIPATPPKEILQQIGRDQVQRMMATLTGAQAMHKLRLTNAGTIPWTTGPATVYKDQTPLAQQLMTYTSGKNTVDLALTTATDLNTRKEDAEVRREPNALHMNNQDYTKVTMHGKLTLTNFKARPVKVVVTRRAMGTASAASADGKISLSNAMEDPAVLTDFINPYGGYSDYVNYWFSANSVSQIVWEATLPEGKAVTLEYDWFYYGR